MKTSLILCTYNPNSDRLQKTLESISRQSLSQTDWELVIIDNNSNPKLDPDNSPQDIKNLRIVRESEPGLTHARIRGIKETSGELIVFVDDDNILSSNYLEIAVKIHNEHLHLGTWGGSCTGEFEAQPDHWIEPYLCYLAVREVDRFVWSNEYRYDIVPCGAGMCLRRFVAEKYIADLESDSGRKNLDRKGKSLMSGGDSDLAFTAIDHGLGIGLHPELKLKHIIPKSRLDPRYLEKLIRSIAFSSVIVHSIRGIETKIKRDARLQRVFNRIKDRNLPQNVKKIEKARKEGLRQGVEFLAQNK